MDGLGDAESSERGDLGERPVDPVRTAGTCTTLNRERLATSRNLVVIFAFVIYLLAVAVITLDSLAVVAGARPHNVIPLRSIVEQLSSAASPAHKLFQLGGNAAMLMPLGMFLACVFARRQALAALLICAIASLAIEVSQYVLQTGRSADVDDILLNAFGGLVGYFIGGALLTALGCRPGFLKIAA